MKIRWLASFLTIGLLLLTACIQQSVEEAQVGFCQALDAWGTAVAELEAVNPGTTVADYQTALNNAVEARQEVVESAASLRQAQLRRVEQAWQNAQDEFNNIPGDATLQQAAAAIRGQALTLATEIARTRNVTCGRR